MDQQLLRSLGIEGDLDVDSATAKSGPGKSTLTSRLTPAPQVVFRVADPETARALGESFGSGRPRIQREADGASGGRDGNGVMAGAEAAVDRAASSSGAPLPTHLQRQFEGSLGADLSGVRVHTGGESQEAAHAVGAKAYTVGSDIHFAAGRYQPEDPFGMHLLAHEVAHTVQQSSGAQRRQHKLEVSTPQDAAEHEADRAADAMVRGEEHRIGAAACGPLARDADPASAVDTAGLKDEFDKVGVAVGTLFNKRAIGIRQALASLSEADPPTIGEEVVKTLAVAALGFGSGLITAKIANRLVDSDTAAALNNALQSAMDDGLKDAATKIASKLSEDSSDSKSGFFAGQEEALECLRQSALNTVVDEKSRAVKRATTSESLAKEVEAAGAFRDAVNANSETARSAQYQASLAKWMTAMAQKETAIEGRDGARLGDEVERLSNDPGKHYGRGGHEAIKGIIYIALGSKEAKRPILGGNIKVGGITTAALDGIRKVPIAELGVPIVVSGYLYDGILDGLSAGFGDNMIAFGKNDTGVVWVNGSNDGMAGLRKATGEDDTIEAARLVLDEDIGQQTLASATVENA